MNPSPTQNFTQVNHNLMASTELNFGQKLFISYVLGWQENGKTCFQSNQSLAKQFGLKYSGIRSLINSLNKYDFFNATKITDNLSSTHTIKVDNSKLQAFLEATVEPLPIPSTSVIEAPVAEPLPTVTTLEPSPSAAPVVQLQPKRKTKTRKMKTPVPALIEEMNKLEDERIIPECEFAVVPHQQAIEQTNEPATGLSKEQAKAEDNLEQYILYKKISLDKVIVNKSDLAFLRPELGQFPMYYENVFNDIQEKFKGQKVTIKEAIPTMQEKLAPLFNRLKTA